ncbi:MAG: sigma-54-dependent Fis family transcriptional regulator [Verrucomicrobia bacterium]|nr:MAG: sigma-54-dependent Fis family transcriptional regulator [Verrucomicrobiota bacterium]
MKMASTSSNPFSCLLVDDDVGLSSMFAKIVAEEGGEPCACHTLAAARKQLEGRSFDLVVLDNRLPDGTGYEFHPQVIRKSPASVVVMITGAPELAQAVELTRNGLFDYLTKPISADAFAALVRRARLRLSRPEPELGSAVLAGKSPAVTKAVQELQQAARHVNATVLLLGETGTGKDLAARMLHQMTFGERAATSPYIAVNCPGVPTEIFEAELFGSEKGAYTGADRRRTGLVEAAEGGTLFLDEVAEIPLGLQSKLLRFLESREYRSIGGTTTRLFTGRVVAATNRSLDAEVSAGRFREDLKYRLDVLSTRLPPLREHLEDIEAIAEALLGQLCEKYERAKPKLRPADLERLRRHTFPGNVRELRNLLERSLLRGEPQAPELEIDLAWLKASVQSRDREGASGPAVTDLRSQSRPDLTPIEQQEYDLIANALLEEDGAIRRAAAKLGLTHQALLRRLQKWPELRRPQPKLEDGR